MSCSKYSFMKGPYIYFSQCPFRDAIQTVDEVMRGRGAPEVASPKTHELTSFDQIPGPKGLPIVGTLFDYFKKDGLRFSKMFEVRRSEFHTFSPSPISSSPSSISPPSSRQPLPLLHHLQNNHHHHFFCFFCILCIFCIFFFFFVLFFFSYTYF